MKFAPLPFSRAVEAVTFEDLLREAKGDFEKSAPKFHYLWSFLYAEAMKGRRNTPKEKRLGGLPESAWMQFTRFSAMLTEHIKIDMDPELVPLAPMTVRTRHFNQSDDECIDDNCETHHIAHGVGAHECEFFDFYLLKVPRSRHGREFATKEKLDVLTSKVLKKASPMMSTKKRTPLMTVMYNALVCLAVKNEHKLPTDINNISSATATWISPTKSSRNKSRTYITRLVTNLDARWPHPNFWPSATEGATVVDEEKS